jgi:uracil-DNA glycosylase family 4
MTERVKAARLQVPESEPSDIYDPGCIRCPRLAAFLKETQRQYPQYWAHPVPSFGDVNPRIVIVGLAPGMHGANATGRPFTGDYAGILLYESLHELGLSSAAESKRADDGLKLRKVRILNAVKCVPPQNKPLPQEIRTCNAYLKMELARLAKVRVIVALGRIAHEAVLLAEGKKRSAIAFGHGLEHRLDEARYLLDSYHCSRYNTQTRVLTPAMFKQVLARARELAEL